MKGKIRNIKQHPKYDTLVQWGKLLSITGGAQIIVQIVGFISGILIIRLLPVQEYALYTLSNTMLGTIALLGDSGISSGVMAEGGKVWQDKYKLGIVLKTGLKLRRKFAIGSFVIALPILSYLLLHQGATLLMTLLIILSLIPAFYAAISDSLLEIVPKLHQNIIPLQQNQITVGVLRLLMTAASVFIFPLTYIAILAGGIPRLFGNIKLSKIADEFVDKEANIDKEVEQKMLKIVKRIFPNAVYAAFSGQIIIWILSITGSSIGLAQIGALGRLTILLNVFGAILGQLMIPRFSRFEENKSLLLKRYIQINAGIILVSIFFVITSWLLRSQILWVLGSNYTDLELELLLSIVGGVLALLGGISFLLAAGRGWVISPIIAIGSNLLAIFAGIFVFDISSVIGLLWFNIFISSVLLLQNNIFVIIKIFKLK
ncbi:lipopolysaccharide biosynthesis protein [Flavobacterium algicola]|uniref:lipopolysaccharide biosynthesis protein n=1 Tax=Flavobacterium algicola TaxID=556529 RepID=UPI001EFC3072|nr:polysaccharide biosynthesis protein [Flavobacterium algicola]MCG9793511.1 polysaccharide biosynthesis protein [Flavobacterium algicola]